MNKWQKIGLGGLILVTMGYIKLAYFPGFQLIPHEQQPAVIQDKTGDNDLNSEEAQLEAAKKTPKETVSVYFIGQNSNKEEVYKIVKREYDSSESVSKVKFALKNLMRGPNLKEQKTGIYTEIPTGTKLLSIQEYPNKVVINLSENFEQGGGTDSLYKRLYQLIKTVNKNTNLDVYLKINGKMVEVVGGEGIMLTQPLNNYSLGE